MRGLLLSLLCLCTISGLSKGVLQLPSDFIIDEEFQRTPLEQVFKKMHRRYQIFFSYSKENVSPYYISIKIDHLPLDEAMERILASTDLSYKILEEKFVLIKKKIPQQPKITSICGWVIDKSSGDHLPYASLQLLGTNKGTICKKDGSFYLASNFPLDSLVRISYLGFKRKEITFGELMRNACAPISLEREETLLPGIVISEYLTDGISQQGHAINLQPQKIRALPGLTEADLFQLTQHLPGITSSDETAAGIQIRGGSPDQTLVSLDGIPIYQTGHFFDMLSSLNPSGIEEAKVFRSGFDASQAGRASGLIQLSQGDSIPLETKRSLSLNLTHVGFHLETPTKNKKAAVFLTGRRSITDVIPSLTFNRLQDRVFQSTRIGDQLEIVREEEDAGFELFNTFVSEDWNSKFIFKPKPRHEISLGQLFTRNRLTYVAEEFEEGDGVSDSVYLHNIGLSANWKFQRTNKHSLNSSLTFSTYNSSYGFRYFELEEEINFEDIVQQNAIYDIRLTHEHAFRPRQNHLWKLGFQATTQAWTYLYSYQGFDEPYEDSFGGVALIPAVYGYHRYVSKQQKFWLESSLRMSYHNLSQELYADPRISADYRIGKDLHIKMHLGIYHQFISQLIQWDFDFGWIDLPVWAISNTQGIPVITSYQGTIGFKYSKKSWLIDVEAYRKSLTGITSLSTNFTTIGDDNFVGGEAEIRGLDVLIKKRWQNVRLWGSYTLSEVEYNFPDVLNEPFLAPQNQTHALTFTSLFDIRSWHVAASYNYRSGRPFTEIQGQSEELVSEGDESYYVVTPIFEDPFEERLPDYHRVDLSIFYQWKGKKHPNRQTSIGLSILNLFNHRNELSNLYFRGYHDIDTPIEERTVENVEKIMLLRSPNLSVKYSW